jgi:hypothetical protein
VQPFAGTPTLECTIVDDTGRLSFLNPDYELRDG